MHTILVTGSKGQLGTELIKIMTSGESELGNVSEFYKDCSIVGIDIDDLDITDLKDVSEFISEKKPYVVINCAAMTNVDACEDNKEQALKVNAIGPRNLAIACEQTGAKLIHISTDYVFDGCGKSPYVEMDTADPKSVYGLSKNLGEQYVRDFCSRWFIVRTAWLYGYSGNNFVKTMVRLGRENGAVKVVDDQRGNPTNAADVAWHICKLLITDEYGIYHCTGIGECSWYDFACEIMKVFNIDADVTPCTTDEIARPAKRPSYSSLDNLMLRCTVGDDSRTWEQALKVFAQNSNL